MQTRVGGLIASVVVLLVSVLIGGCSSSKPAPTAAGGGAGGTKSPRGLLVTKLGEAARIGGADKKDLVVFVIETITLDKKCTASYAREADNGHFLMVSIKLEATAALPEKSRVIMSPYDFSIVGEDGVTEDGLATPAAANCLPPNQQMPNTPFEPSKQYRGVMVLDTENPTGTLIYRPSFGNTGWEWTYPATAASSSPKTSTTRSSAEPTAASDRVEPTRSR